MYKLKLNGIALNTYLGVYDFEQQQMQTVLVDVIVEFKNIPKACISDALEDTFCYAQINEVLMRTAASKRYQLIEHLAQSLLDALVLHLNHPLNVYLELHKTPPLENVVNASFCVEYICQK
ncbi:dihydroneopterin aldolase [Fastidiosibacter lacustris]|uniref:dihydroneopterin aldolase n=1 Tax=Fastidiosibacter lacustris TaxID=2056695 RepID=UPI000E346DC4|nr:dihydroneopterin aldolase [Fastidiosibacter lacustris]